MGHTVHDSLSIIVMSGATRVAAPAPATTSEASRRPRFRVFHARGSINGASRAGGEETRGLGSSMLPLAGGGVSSDRGRVIAWQQVLCQYIARNEWRI